MRFPTVMIQTGDDTGIEVPAAVLGASGGGRRPAVTVTVGDHSFASTVGARGGRSLDLAGVTGAFAVLAPITRKGHVVSVEGAKTKATRARRIVGIVQKLQG